MPRYAPGSWLADHKRVPGSPARAAGRFRVVPGDRLGDTFVTCIGESGVMLADGTVLKMTGPR